MLKPRNTSKELSLGCLSVLVAGPAAIEAQESTGQQELVASQSLPSSVHGRDKWETLGFVFGAPFADDPLFCPVTMPAGWTKRATEHSMHSDIIDNQGRARGGFFYKAAFYDRKAYMGEPDPRYYIESVYDEAREDQDACKVLDRATGETLFESDVFESQKDGWKLARDQATKWLADHHPDWKDSAAYW